jgi:predicted kinase
MVAVDLVLISGAPGAGKSTALTALSDALADADVRHATFEFDALVRSHPPLVANHAFEHVGMLAAAYREKRYPLLLMSATLESRWYYQALVGAIGADSAFLVRLEADPATLERRVREREPAGWSGLERVLSSCAPLAATHAKLEDVDLAISTETASPDHVAAQIRAAIGR